jgi:uncharacterized protein YkwD
MLRHARRLLPLVVAALALSTAAGPAAAADLTVAQAERYVVSLLNQQRQAAGLVPLRVDTRIESLARQRSADMAKYNYFDHRHHDGRYVWDMMTDAKITWYWAGEIIAWNNWGTLKESAEAAARGWRNSAPHYAIVTSKDYNYIGAGYAYDSGDGRKLWTAVFLKGPDRTGAWAKLGTSATTTCSTSRGYRYLKYSWSGADYRLQVLTAGLRYFQVQRRIDGGTWQWVATSTTATSRAGCVPSGHKYEYRIRARDRAGNVGSWTQVLSVQT